jgi:hypothetical protein
VAIGAPWNDVGGLAAGRVWLFLGFDVTSPLDLLSSDADLTITGSAAGHNFGCAVAGIGDSNGDGLDDLLLGASAASKAYVFCGRRETLVSNVDANQADQIYVGDPNEAFGVRVAGIGNVNADGYQDFAVGAIGNDQAGEDAGRALVYLCDADRDGLHDLWEVDGVPLRDGLGTYALAGADPLHKDLYLEIDAMEDLAPSTSVLDSVVQAYADVPNALLNSPNPDGLDGITLHIVGDGCGSLPCVDDRHIRPEDWSASGWPEFESVKRRYFGTVSERGSTDSTMILEAKAKAYRYCVFARSQGTSSVSGRAEYPLGNDCMVTLGLWPTPGGTSEQQAGTLMHEIGHMLGLKHGGADDTCYKPNYYSVMNYTWTVPVYVPLGTQGRALQNYRSCWRLDYARYAFNVLNESSLDEVAGLWGTIHVWVPAGPTGVTVFPQLVSSGERWNWDRDSTPDEPSATADVNYVLGQTVPPMQKPSPGDTLVAPLDWPELCYLPNLERVWTDPGYHGSPSLRDDGLPEELTWELVQAMSDLRFDCNGNGIADDAEIDSGALADENDNGIPDVCEAWAASAPETPVAAATPGLTLHAGNPGANGADLWWTQEAESPTMLRVYDVAGRLVVVLVDGVLSAGKHNITWDGCDEAGRKVGAGLYICHLKTMAGQTTARALILHR